MSDARILDQGYNRYEGERRGVRGAVRSLVRHSIQRALGLKRSGWAKVLPALVVVLSFVPAIVIVGVAALANGSPIGPGETVEYSGYYGIIVLAIVLFVGFVGPELLCPDRKTGMLGLYLASPLTRDTYLLGKALAIGAVLAIVTLGPPLLMLIGFTFEGQGPDGPVDFVLVLVRMIAAGIAVSVLYTAVSLAVSATTTRRAAATAAIILVILASSIFASIMVDEAGWPSSFLLVDLLGMPFELVVRIFAEDPVDRTQKVREVSTVAIVAGYAAWTVAFAAFTRFRYQRFEVTR